MKRKNSATTLSTARGIIMIGVVASLLFSVGEGLRFVPFFSSSVHSATTQHFVGADPHEPLAQYGPMDLPAQARKRTKRQVLEFEAPPYVTPLEVPRVFIALIAPNIPARQATFAGTRAADRAPPC
jgi:hypothetical protein